MTCEPGVGLTVCEWQTDWLGMFKTDFANLNLLAEAQQLIDLKYELEAVFHDGDTG